MNASKIYINQLLFGEVQLESMIHETGVRNSSKLWDTIIFDTETNAMEGAEVADANKPTIGQIANWCCRVAEEVKGDTSFSLKLP